MPSYTAQLAIAPNGNPQLTLLPVPRATTPHPSFPPMAFPHKDVPTPADAMRYARALLQTAGVLRPDAPELDWQAYGYTRQEDGSTRPVYRAQVQAPAL